MSNFARVDDGMEHSRSVWPASSMVLKMGVMVVAMAMIWFVVSPELDLKQDRRTHERQTSLAQQEWAEPVAHAVYYLALPYLTDQQADAFEQRLKTVPGRTPHMYEKIATDIFNVAVYGLDASVPMDQMLAAATEKMSATEVDDRQRLMLELQRAYLVMASHRSAAADIRTRADLAAAVDTFERSKKQLIATMIKYSEQYSALQP